MKHFFLTKNQMKHEEPRSEVYEFTTNRGISMVMFL